MLIILLFRILNFTNEEWKKTIDAYRQLERDVNLAKQAALAAKQQLEEAYKIMKPIGSDSIHDRASLMFADSTRLLARAENNKNIPSKQSTFIKQKFVIIRSVFVFQACGNIRSKLRQHGWICNQTGK